MQFEWDAAKAASNLAKHGIDFDDALRVEDERRDYGERRFRVLGRVDDRILFVVCTWRGGVCRLISARRADAREKRRYEAGDL